MATFNNLIKDHFKRKNFVKKFLKKTIYKSLLYNSKISLQERQIIYIKFIKYNHKFSISRLKTYCFMTGHSRAIYKCVLLNRHFFKNMVLNGAIPGWIVSSW